MAKALAMKTGQVIYLMKGEPGDDGKPGSRGPSLRGPMDWDKVAIGFEFLSGKEGEQFVDYVVKDGVFYLCTTSHDKTEGNGPGSDYDYWQAASEYPFVATDLLLAAYAIIENLGVRFVELSEGGYIRMTDGSDNVLFEVKDGNVTCNTGTFKNVTVSGALQGVTGSFKSLNCVDDDGNVVCQITFSQDGQMWFNNGDLYHQGTKAGRSLRFFASDLWCRGAFGAHQRLTARVVGAKVDYYPNGLDGVVASLTMTRKTSTNGVAYYEIPCYGQSGGAQGMPVDTIVFRNRSEYNYVLDLANTQHVRCINGTDEPSTTTHLILNGTRTVMPGGTCWEVSKLPTDDTWMSTPSTANAVGAGLLITGSYDNNW